MRIKATSAGIVLYRYAGLNNGKSVEAKIATVALDIDPENLPDDILDVLTRGEVRQLQEYLDGERSRKAVDRADAVTAAMAAVSNDIDRGLVDVRSVEAVLVQCAGLQASARRFLKRSRPTDPLVATPAG